MWGNRIAFQIRKHDSTLPGDIPEAINGCIVGFPCQESRNDAEAPVASSVETRTLQGYSCDCVVPLVSNSAYESQGPGIAPLGCFGRVSTSRLLPGHDLEALDVGQATVKRDREVDKKGLEFKPRRLFRALHWGNKAKTLLSPQSIHRANLTKPIKISHMVPRGSSLLAS